MTKNVLSFLNDEAGAVTVDWVVLTAGLVGLGLATMAVVSAGVEDLSDDIDSTLKNDGIIVTSFGFADLTGIFSATDHPTAIVRSWGYDVSGVVEGWDVGNRGTLLENGHGGIDLGDAAYGVDLFTGTFNGMSREIDDIGLGRTHTLSITAADYGTTGLAQVTWGGEVIGTFDPDNGTVSNHTFEITGGTGDGSNVLAIEEIGSAPSGVATVVTDVQIN